LIGRGGGRPHFEEYVVQRGGSGQRVKAVWKRESLKSPFFGKGVMANGVAQRPSATRKGEKSVAETGVPFLVSLNEGGVDHSNKGPPRKTRGGETGLPSVEELTCKATVLIRNPGSRDRERGEKKQVVCSSKNWHHFDAKGNRSN